MKKSLLITGVLLAFSTLNAQQKICIQKTQAAVSPEGVCQEYPTPCEVPTDWKSVPSCDLVSEEKKESPSLAERMLKRIYYGKKRSNTTETETQNTVSENTKQIPASGAYTRTKERYKRLSTATDAISTSGVKAFTEKDYGKEGLATRKQYNHKGGFEREDDPTKAERIARKSARPSFMSTTKANRSGELKNTLNWDTEQKSHLSTKNYNKNPYRFKSQYEDKQKEARTAANKAVDIQKRLMSRSRKFRGERINGSLESEIYKNR